MLYRARVVFNGPGRREHPFYSAPRKSLPLIIEVLHDMRYPLKHAVSVQVQRTVDPRGTVWETCATDQWLPLYKAGA